MELGYLDTTLSLTIGGTSYDIPGGQIKELDLTLERWGFAGRLAFVLMDDSGHAGPFADELATAFVGSALVTLSCSFQWHYFDGETSAQQAPISLSALVTAKKLFEHVYRHRDDTPVLARRYEIELADPAQVLWRQHHPCALYTNTSVSDILSKHAGSEITIDCQHRDLTEAEALFFVHLPIEREVSFYDFVMWYLDCQGGIWEYDYSSGQYVIRSDKDASAAPTQLDFDHAGRVELTLAPAPRYKPRVLNSYAGNALCQEIHNSEAVAGVYRDTLLRTQISQDVDERVTLETARLRIPVYRADIELVRGPAQYLAPGTLVELSTASRWSSESALVGKTWRVTRLSLAAAAQEDALEADSQQGGTAVAGTLKLALEQSDDPCTAFPAYRAPHYPGFIEGMIVSTQGEDTDITYSIYTDQDTSLEYYKVKVPLWENQEILCPFEPSQGSGNVYIPAYRDARVLVAMELTSARIHWLLDWRAGAAMSEDAQGEQMYFGKHASSRTVVNHRYEDDDPLFVIERLHDRDTSTLRLQEGAFILEVKETTDG